MPPKRRLSDGRAAAVAAVLLLSARMAGADQTVQVGPELVFSPATVTVAPGEAVIWSFADPLMPHSTTSDATTGPEVWDSGILMSGTFSHTFNTPGTYEYYCVVHSSAGGTVMNGVVQVLGGATATPTPTIPPATATPTIVPPTNTPTVASATATPTLTAVAATATPSTPVPTVTPTVPIAATATATVTATPIGTPSGGIPTTTPLGESAVIPVLDARSRAIAVLALALAGVAAIFLAQRR